MGLNAKALFTAATALLLIGCGGPEYTLLPGERLALKSEQVLQEARQEGAQEYAPGQYRVAQEKVSRARAGFQYVMLEELDSDDEQYIAARRTGEQAIADAELALAVGRANRDEARAVEIELENDRLRNRLNQLQTRQGGASQ